MKKKKQRKSEKFKLTLIKKIDQAVSILCRQKGYCEWCGRKAHLQCAHIIPRRYKNLRWDPDNLLCLCAGCHKFKWHENPVEAFRWLEEYKGREYIERLVKIKNKPHKPYTYEELEKLFEKFKELLP